MTSMEIQFAEGLSTAQNNGIEASAKIAEIYGKRPGYAQAAQDIAANIRLLKTSAQEVLEGANPTTPEAAE